MSGLGSGGSIKRIALPISTTRAFALFRISRGTQTGSTQEMSVGEEALSFPTGKKEGTETVTLSSNFRY
jgi:hypothetical protein